MRQKISRFMQGRYGTDQLSQCMVYLCLILIIVNLFLKWAVFRYAVLVLLVICYFRMFSRNIPKRYAENTHFLNATAKYRNMILRQKNLMIQRKHYHIYQCPSCRQKVRVPRGKGNILITCPKCHTEFHKKS